MPKFFLTEKTRTFHENADRHQTEEGNDAAECDKKIAKHKKASPPIRLYYNRKEVERQRIKALALRSINSLYSSCMYSKIKRERWDEIWHTHCH